MGNTLRERPSTKGSVRVNPNIVPRPIEKTQHHQSGHVFNENVGMHVRVDKEERIIYPIFQKAG